MLNAPSSMDPLRIPVRHREPREHRLVDRFLNDRTWLPANGEYHVEAGEGVKCLAFDDMTLNDSLADQWYAYPRKTDDARDISPLEWNGDQDNDCRWVQQVRNLTPGTTNWISGWLKGEAITPESGKNVGANLCLEGTWTARSSSRPTW